MPVCRSAACALARSRSAINASPSKTLTPFLYLTPTIQQWRPITSGTTYASRYRESDHIPFEDVKEAPDDDETLPPRIDNAAIPARKSTITGGERAAFERLYKRFSQEAKPHETDDQVFDEYYEEDDDGSKDDDAADLDTLFDSVLDAPSMARGRTREKPADTLQTMAESLLHPEREIEQRRKQLAQRRAKQKLEALAKKERKRVKELITQVRTDRDVWEILNAEVFSKIQALDLDAKAMPQKKQGVPLKEIPNAQVLFATLPSHLLFATRHLCTLYPTSPLPLHVIPTLKSLGRGAYALCATAALYNLVLRKAWIQHNSYTYLDTLLREMENGGIEFNVSTLMFLHEVCLEWTKGRKGMHGKMVRGIFRMDMYAEGAKKMEGWRDLIKRRLAPKMDAIRQKQDKIRKIRVA